MNSFFRLPSQLFHSLSQRVSPSSLVHPKQRLGCNDDSAMGSLIVSPVHRTAPDLDKIGIFKINVIQYVVVAAFV